MKITCLSKGSGYHFPPCHVLEISGFRILLECPLDLSALAAFAPIPTSSSSSPHPLIQSKPWYKTVSSLSRWDPSLFDAVLISTPAGFLGLPFLSRSPDFDAVIYTTEPTARLGRLLMEELLCLDAEFCQFYGRDNGYPEWTGWSQVARLPPSMRAIVAGEDGDEVRSWMPLYSAMDVKECMLRVRTVRYAEEACFKELLLLKAFSSGLEIGSCNWKINVPTIDLAYLTSAIFHSGHATGFDHPSIQGSDMVLFSDLSALDCKGKDPVSCSTSDVRPMRNEETDNSLPGSDEVLEETGKIADMCSCIVDSLKVGGSVLIPIGRVGVVLQLLEKISQSLESSNLKHFFGESPFGHVELVKEKKLHLFSALDSRSLIMEWQEPCIVFSPHYSLRFGPTVNLLHRWRADSRCLLILEQGIDPELALLPFKPLTIRVFQCSFLSGTKPQNVKPLLELLKPKLVLGPGDLALYQTLYYRENVRLNVSSLRDEDHVDESVSFWR